MIGAAKCLFFDVDGVFNPHDPFPNGYCGMSERLITQLMYVLLACPDVNLVVSSAWRYMILNGHMDYRGFEFLMMIHGAPFQLLNERIIGHTESDSRTCYELGIAEADDNDLIDYLWLKDNGCELRAVQIERWAKANNVTRFAVLDDLQVGCEDGLLWLTDGERGITFNHSWELIEFFQGPLPITNSLDTPTKEGCVGTVDRGTEIGIGHQLVTEQAPLVSQKESEKAAAATERREGL